MSFGKFAVQHPNGGSHQTNPTIAGPSEFSFAGVLGSLKSLSDPMQSVVAVAVDASADVLVGGTPMLRALLESAGSELSWKYFVRPYAHGYLPSYGRLGDAAEKAAYSILYTSLMRRLTGGRLNLRTAAAIGLSSLATRYAMDE